MSLYNVIGYHVTISEGHGYYVTLLEGHMITNHPI